VRTIVYLRRQLGSVSPNRNLGVLLLSYQIVRHGHIEVQRLLRSYGGQLNIDPIELGTMLCEAAATGDLQKIQILAENGANINQGKQPGINVRKNLSQTITIFSGRVVCFHIMKVTMINEQVCRCPLLTIANTYREYLNANTWLTCACSIASGCLLEQA